MNPGIIRAMTPWLTTVLLAACTCTGALAHGFRAGDIAIDHPYAMAANGQVAVYFRALRNTGAQADTLLAASTPAAARAELTGADDTVSPLALPAGSEQALRHTGGGWRIALRDLKAPLKAGDEFKVTLRFQRAGDTTVPITVIAPK
ncbi:MAG: copper chaperone PCu(A)C [Burkholderiales bacterium]|nr:copper chaperone PCu(A)C [Burkholderiales bacterium]